MSESDRRFTDREVALVLKKAAEIDEREGAGGASGLSAQDLEEIAREVGISEHALTRAIESLQSGHDRSLPPMVTGGPASHKAIHAVGGELDEGALNRLLRLVDERMESTGAVSEALGSVRWTSSDRFSSTQVTITPQDGETTIQVSEKMLPRWKRVLHAVPTAWGAILGMAFVQGQNAEFAAISIIGGAIAGLLAGRGVWNYRSGVSEKRVQRLAADLSREAYNAARAGMVTDGEEPESDPST